MELFIKKSSSAPDSSITKVEIQANNSAYKIYGWWSGTEFYWYCEEDPSPLLNSYMKDLFANCNNLEDISGLADFDSSSVTNIQGMFQNARKVNSLECFSRWNTSSLVLMQNSFQNTAITSLSGLENWDFSSATSMAVMFYGLSNLTDATAITDWNVTSSINFTKMFQNCNRVTLPTFTNLPGSWDNTGTYTPTV